MSAVMVMGVSAAGKSTVARALCERLGWEYVDADDLHPAQNIAKMTSGIPLNDEDRRPWLARIAEVVAQQREAPGVVVACSALRRTYRDQIRSQRRVVFLHLHAERAVLVSRIASRENHFMPASLLDSQLAVLEPLSHDEHGAVIDADATVEAIVDSAVEWIKQNDG